MPRRVTERWVGCGWAVRQEQEQAVGQDGQPLFDGSGLPKMVDLTTLVFVSNEPGAAFVLEVPFTDDKRADLVKALTGGIIVPTANGHGSLEV